MAEDSRTGRQIADAILRRGPVTQDELSALALEYLKVMNMVQTVAQAWTTVADRLRDLESLTMRS